MEASTSNDGGSPRPSFCQFCGNGISEGAVVCPSCGNKLYTETNNGMSIAGIVLGIGGLLFCWASFFGLIISAIGVGFAIVAAKDKQKLYEWGIALTCVAFFVGLLVLMVASQPV